MLAEPIHFDKNAIDSSLAERLVAAQFPQWAELPITPVHHQGWDNRTFRLGTELSVRLPSAAQYALQVEKEHRWLPRLAPELPLPIPVPLAVGEPGEGFPWPWSVYRWIEGEPATIERIADLSAFARTLAEFLVALRAVDARGGPSPGPHNFYRGAPVAVYDDETRRALSALTGEIDIIAARAVWDAAIATTWTADPVWFHGDVARSWTIRAARCFARSWGSTRRPGPAVGAGPSGRR
jgi:aminoglycoside phosphotransferase (APT) family kinase protein